MGHDTIIIIIVLSVINFHARIYSERITQRSLVKGWIYKRQCEREMDCLS